MSLSLDDPVSPPRIAATDLVERVPEIPRHTNPGQVQIRDSIIYNSTQQFREPNQGPTEESQSGADSRSAGVANTLWDQALAGLDPKKRRLLPIDGLERTSQLNIDSLIEVAAIKKDQCLEKRWKFQVGDTTFNLSEKAENIISCVNKLKGIGDVAVQHDAGNAALPWAAIRLVLQVR